LNDWSQVVFIRAKTVEENQKSITGSERPDEVNPQQTRILIH